MLSVIPFLALALVMQSEPAPAAPAEDGVIATAPAVASPVPDLALAPPVIAAATSAPAAAPATADDPIGALVNAAAQEEGEDGAPSEQAATTASIAGQPRPSMTYPAPYASAPVPSSPQPYAPQSSGPQPYVPQGPRPYASLPPTTGPVRPIYAAPLVRLPPKPQGSLDGAWTLAEADRGDQLYQFQFNDTGGGNEIEGAWRDVRRSTALIGSGPVSSVGYDGMAVTIRFLEKGAGEMSVVTLRPAANGGWSGELRGHEGSSPVVMRRN